MSGKGDIGLNRETLQVIQSRHATGGSALQCALL